MHGKRVAFITTAHTAEDDRIYYHLVASLVSKGFETAIFTSNSVIDNLADNLIIKGFQGNELLKSDKINSFVRLLKDFKPDIIICSEPLAILSAIRYRKKNNKKVPVVYDVTEWYPSKKNFSNKKPLLKPFIFVKLLFFNLYASFFVDAFIFGEHYKSLPYRFLFPFRHAAFVGYYPDLRFIQYIPAEFTANKICLGFTGKLSKERGIINFLKTAKQLKSIVPEVNLKLKIIGWFANVIEQQEFSKAKEEIDDVEIEIIDSLSYLQFSQSLQEIDIFFDLRAIDIINNYGLPIKLFYYAACGRPVIFSNLKAIRREVDVSEFGYLVDPNDAEKIALLIQKYLRQPGLYLNHSNRARELSETKYNWNLLQPKFLSFINQFFIK